MPQTVSALVAVTRHVCNSVSSPPVAKAAKGGEQAERQRGRAGREPRLCQRPGKCIEYRQRSYEERQLKRPREHLDVSPDHVRDGKDHGPQEMV
jgi:hypothetical protein